MILQPKRWERAENPRFDPIRHKPWFNRLLKRKHIIPMMEGCYLQSKNPDCLLKQNELCDLWNVSPREFRDYVCFVENRGYEFTTKEFQSILNAAYKAYSEHNAIRPIQRFIADFAPLYGKNYRHVWEQWEVDPTFYPANYAHLPIRN